MTDGCGCGIGQIGRALGPIVFCKFSFFWPPARGRFFCSHVLTRIGTFYWWAGRELAYMAGGFGMLAVAGVFWATIEEPRKVSVGEKNE